MLTAGGHEDPAHFGVFADLHIQDFAPLYARWRRIGVATCCRASLTADAAPQIGDHCPPGHGESPTRRKETRTRSALEPVASVSFIDIGVTVFIDGTWKSLA